VTGGYGTEIRRSAAETCRQALGDERFESYRQRGLELSVAEAIAVARNEVPVPADKISADPLTRREAPCPYSLATFDGPPPRRG
jgi:hypothetical protein